MVQSWVSSWATNERRTGRVGRPTCSRGKAQARISYTDKVFSIFVWNYIGRPVCPTQPPLTRVLVTSVPLLPPLFPFPPPPWWRVRGWSQEGAQGGRRAALAQSVRCRRRVRHHPSLSAPPQPGRLVPARLVPPQLLPRKLLLLGSQRAGVFTNPPGLRQFIPLMAFVTKIHRSELFLACMAHTRTPSHPLHRDPHRRLHS